MAARLGLSGHDRPPQRSIAGPVWDDAPLWRMLAEGLVGWWTDRGQRGDAAAKEAWMGFAPFRPMRP